jgi:predicted dehydrogenase
LDDTFNVAVIGAGYWGKKVINEYLQLARDDVKVGLSMVCDIKNENLAYCQKEYGISERKLSLSYEEAFNSGSVDAVHICTPNETHHEICKQALMAGKHVLLEKPMAMCAKDAWELVGLAEHNHLILQVGHIFRFNNALRTVRDLVTQNYFGTLYYLKLQWTTLMSSLGSPISLHKTHKVRETGTPQLHIAINPRQHRKDAGKCKSKFARHIPPPETSARLHFKPRIRPNKTRPGSPNNKRNKPKRT